MDLEMRLDPMRGDETIIGLRQAFRYGPVTELTAMMANGIPYYEGIAAVSADMSQVRRSAGQIPAGYGMLLLDTPAGATLGYAILTDAIIDRTKHRVMGAPLRYAAARQQLAFYMQPAWRNLRLEIETEFLAKRLQPKALVLHPSAALGMLPVSEGVVTVIEEIVTAAFDASSIRLDDIAQYLVAETQTSQQVPPDILATTVRSLINGTITSLVMQRLRIMRFEGLAGQGYTITQDGRPIPNLRAVSGNEQLAAIRDYDQRIAGSGLLEGELSWLKPYTHHALEVMRVETSGAS